jgi:hypothetical protein
LWCRHGTSRENVYPAIEVLDEMMQSILILSDILEIESLCGIHAVILRGHREEGLIDKWRAAIEEIDNEERLPLAQRSR